MPGMRFRPQRHGAVAGAFGKNKGPVRKPVKSEPVAGKPSAKSVVRSSASQPRVHMPAFLVHNASRGLLGRASALARNPKVKVLFEGNEKQVKMEITLRDGPGKVSMSFTPESSSGNMVVPASLKMAVELNGQKRSVTFPISKSNFGGAFAKALRQTVEMGERMTTYDRPGRLLTSFIFPKA
ncbi:MAG: hypothetical protein Q7S92_03310 [Candidatus Diapherotrites archaeon]|nr:hypothetical protein [Candidatus Diapherotrites archaeon]